MSCNQTPNNCGCNQAPKCAPASKCGCKVKISSDCVDNVRSVFECLGIESNLTLTQTLTAIDQAICTLLQAQQTNFTLQNVGNGQTIYKGVSVLGAKQIKSLLGSDSIIVTSNEANTEVSFTINTEWLEQQIGNTYTASNVGSGVGVFKQLNDDDFEFKSLTSEDGTIIIEGKTNTVDFRANIALQGQGSASVSGQGTAISPFIVTATDTVVTLQNGVTTIVQGNGVATPYSVETVNLQKAITINDSTPYTLLSTDDKHTIFVTNNGLVNTVARIRVPNTLPNNFSVVFVSETLVDNSIVFEAVSGGTANIIKPNGYEPSIAGNASWACLEKKLATQDYYLLGNLIETP